MGKEEVPVGGCPAEGKGELAWPLCPLTPTHRSKQDPRSERQGPS